MGATQSPESHYHTEAQTILIVGSTKFCTYPFPIVIHIYWLLDHFRNALDACWILAWVWETLEIFNLILISSSSICPIIYHQRSGWVTWSVVCWPTWVTRRGLPCHQHLELSIFFVVWLYMISDLRLFRSKSLNFSSIFTNTKKLECTKLLSFFLKLTDSSARNNTNVCSPICCMVFWTVSKPIDLLPGRWVPSFFSSVLSSPTLSSLRKHF